MLALTAVALEACGAVTRPTFWPALLACLPHVLVLLALAKAAPPRVESPA
jgi:hypothetical protein